MKIKLLGGMFVSNSVKITGGNFHSEVLQSPVPALLDFWAPWCGPCKMIKPLLDQIAEEYDGHIKIGQINIDEESALAEQHGIVSIPTLILYKNGELAAQKTGAAPKRDIVAFFKNLL